MRHTTVLKHHTFYDRSRKQMCGLLFAGGEISFEVCFAAGKIKSVLFRGIFSRIFCFSRT